MKAMATAETSAVGHLRAAGKKERNWTAELAYLERKFPKKWGQRINMNVDEELEKFLDTLKRNLSEEDYDRVLRAAHDPDSREANRGSEG